MTSQDYLNFCYFNLLDLYNTMQYNSNIGGLNEPLFHHGSLELLVPSPI